MINRQNYSLYLVLGICLLLSWLYCPLYDLGISDKPIFTYFGWAVTKGLVPYRDFFDHKPPLIYFFYAAGLFFGGPWGLWALNTILALLTTGFLFKLCKRYCLAWPGLLPLLFNLMLRDKLISEGNNMTREYTAFFYILFFCILLSDSKYRFFLLGLFTGLTFFMQQDQVLPLLPFLLYALLSLDYSARFLPFLKIAAGVVVAMTPVLLFFVFHHALSDLWQQAFQFNLSVYTTEKKSLMDHFRTIKLVLDEGNYELPFIMALCLGILSLAGKNRNKPLTLAALAGLLLTLSPELMGGRFKGGTIATHTFYYFLPLSASICVLLFTVFAFSEDYIPHDRLRQLPFALLLICSLTYTAFQHATHLERRDHDPVIASPELNYLRMHRPGNYQLFVFQNEDYIEAYYEFRILAPSRWTYQHFWSWYSNWDADGSILRSIGDDLLKHRTTYVIMDEEHLMPFQNPAHYSWWMSFMKSHYERVPMPAGQPSILWKQKGQPYSSSSRNPFPGRTPFSVLSGIQHSLTGSCSKKVT